MVQYHGLYKLKTVFDALTIYLVIQGSKVLIIRPYKDKDKDKDKFISR